MSRLFKKSVLILIFAFAGLSLFMSCSKAPQQADDNSEDVPIRTEGTTKQTAEEIEAYWTEERMRKAKPMPMGRPESEAPVDADDGQATDLQEGLPADASTQPGDAPGGAPGGGQQPDPTN